MSRTPITPELWEQARAMWEGDTKTSYSDVGAFLAISKQAVAKKAKDQKWQKRMDLPKVVNRAHQQADRQAVRDDLRLANSARAASEQLPGVDESGLVNVDSAPDPAPSVDTSHMTPEQKVEQLAIDKRAEVIGRHRLELVGVRNLAYSAIRAKDDAIGFVAGKRAKVVAEALAIIQNAERKAWGLDKGEDDKPTTIILERG